MIVQTKLTSKGRLTLPRVIRELLGVGEGDQVTFVVTDHSIQLKAVPRRSVDELFDSLTPKEAAYPGLEEEKRIMRQRHLERMGQV